MSADDIRALQGEFLDARCRAATRSGTFANVIFIDPGVITQESLWSLALLIVQLSVAKEKQPVKFLSPVMLFFFLLNI